MKTIDEIRLENLDLLIGEFGSQEKVAELGDTSSVYLSQIRNRTPDAKTGKPRQMGDPMARKLEEGCKKERGWMDHQQVPHTYRSAKLQAAIGVMEHMEDWQLDQAIKIVNTIAEPHPKAADGRER